MVFDMRNVKCQCKKLDLNKNVYNFDIFYLSVGPPSIPTIVTVNEKGHDAATVLWNEGFHGGFNQSVYIEIRSDRSNVTQKLQDISLRDTSTTRNSTITGLEGATTYYVRLFATNPHGVSGMSRVWNFTTAGNDSYVSPPSGEDILFLPCPSGCLSVCPSVTLRFRSITQVPFDPQPSNFIG